MSKVDFHLYLITGGYLLPQNILVKRIEELVKAGIRAVQIREKDLCARELLKLSLNIREVTQKNSSKLFLNDRADIAFAVDADGLHIPEHGFPADEARKILKDRLIGKSAHSLEAAIRAEREGADFITLGPIYDTPSKQKYGKPLGIEILCEVARKISIPLFAIGGITPERAKECIDSGAYGVAVISDLLLTEKPEKRVEEYQNIF
jgi:thiamine-phosphate pyrophosphorylase